ncbi:Os03g0831625 [Oryza sativa Japonica Group]|uniref:Os03g0831625 protein n=1 Tax=Oryza sativa subsp. japonica TaxID=39947 RepID=A0A0P0W521_ORYSJ|nr:Os03g0831625 [Oryza sativa Japonica Group]
MSSLAAGACFASAGAGYDNATSDLFSVLPMWKELDYFKEYAARLQSFRGDDDAAAAATLSEALYIVSMGTKDFLENYYAMARAQAAEYSTAVAYGDYLLGIGASPSRTRSSASCTRSVPARSTLTASRPWAASRWSAPRGAAARVPTRKTPSSSASTPASRT